MSKEEEMIERYSVMSNIAALQDWMFEEGSNQLDDGHYVKGCALTFGAGAIDGFEIACLSLGLAFVGLGVYCKIKK